MKKITSFIYQTYISIKTHVFIQLHKVIIPLRYKSKAINIQILNQPKPKDPKAGWLILPSHPSHIDGTLLVNQMVKNNHFVHIWISDVVKEFPYFKIVGNKNKFFKFLWVKPIEEKISTDHPQHIDELVTHTIETLKKGENVVLFPTAHVKFVPKNVMKGKSAVNSILKLYPDANIVFLRIKGMWGSRFSNASKREEHLKDATYLGKHLSLMFKKFFHSLLKNGIFFMPKRKVEFEFILAPDDFPRHGTRIEINKYIENFLNQGWGIEGEPVYRVPEFFWKKEYVDLAYEEKLFHFNLDDASDAVKNDILQMIYKMTDLQPHQLDFNMYLGRDLGIDSLDLQAILTILDNKYGVKNVAPIQLSTIGHIIALASKIPITEIIVKRKISNEIVQESFLPNFFEKVKKNFCSVLGLF